MIRRIANVSPSFKARMAGAFFSLTMLTAVFSELIAHGRLGLAADVVEASGMLAMTLLLYAVFKPVNTGLSLLAVAFNLVGLALESLQWQPRGVGVGLVLHGIYWLLIGYLIFRSTFLPRILSALMTIAGLGWLTYLSPPLANYLSPYNVGIAIAAEGLMMLWLLVVGVNVQRWNRQASGQLAFDPLMKAAA